MSVRGGFWSKLGANLEQSCDKLSSDQFFLALIEIFLEKDMFATSLMFRNNVLGNNIV